MGKFLFTVFSGLSELERDIINERTEESRRLAKNRGVKFGRKQTLTPHQQEQVRAMLSDNHPIREIARHFNVGVATIDRIKRKSQPA
jgi:DNA invertase Pin-like site-specific DNA recombinase